MHSPIVFAGTMIEWCWNSDGMVLELRRNQAGTVLERSCNHAKAAMQLWYSRAENKIVY